ncbi:FAD-binding protein [Streptomyces pathocidini]|uniref:FAD-binding protein n=1 Tax=Streptomyces pathocidini TaxID=1650571 RepID=UPI003F4D0510
MVLRSAPAGSDSPRLLSGWGRTAPSRAVVVRPGSLDAAREAVASVGSRGVIPRGLGRSYGDPAQNCGGTVLDTTGLNHIVEFDTESGLAVCEAGVSLDQLISRGLSAGWFVPVTPGTRQVTVGGAIAADVHGKNHHELGSFGRHVKALRLLTADGTVRDVTPRTEPELFWATVGGMGLTGMILSATVQLIPVESSLVSVRTDRTPDLDTCMELMADLDAEYPYTVAWLDCLARGRNLGRSVVTCGSFASVEELPERKRQAPLQFSPGKPITAPDVFPRQLLNTATVKVFNEFWYRKAPLHKTGQLQSISTFFHPLDALAEWNRVYGHTGMLQYQFVVPFEQADVVRRVLQRISSAGVPSFLTVLKRFGAESQGYLSFPKPGWTLAMDFPTWIPGLSGLLDELDEQILAADGRLYLAKDSRMRPEHLSAMYPRLDRFRALRAEVDPEGVFMSDQARRLAL